MTVREFLAGHRLAAGDRFTRRAMIAPARVAAYDILCAVSAGTRRPADRDRGRARRPARRPRPRARRRDRHRRPAMARRARSPHRRSSPSARSIGSIRRSSRSCASAPTSCSTSRASPPSAVVDDAVDLARRAGKRSASGFVNAVLRAISRRRASLPLPAAARRSGRPRRPRSTISASRSRIRAGSPRAGSTGSASTRPKRGCSSTTRRRR